MFRLPVLITALAIVLGGRELSAQADFKLKSSVRSPLAEFKGDAFICSHPEYVSLTMRSDSGGWPAIYLKLPFPRPVPMRFAGELAEVTADLIFGSEVSAWQRWGDGVVDVKRSGDTYIGTARFSKPDSIMEFTFFAEFLGSVPEDSECTPSARRDAIRRADWPARYRNAVSANRVILGMSREMVILAIGHPIESTARVTKDGRSERMVYGSKSFVVLVNGRVASIEFPVGAP